MKAFAFITVALLLACAVVVGAAAAQSVSDDHQIIPGDRIGPLKIGMSITDAVAAMGQPKTVLPDKKVRGETRYYWFDITELGGNSVTSAHGLFAVADSSGTIVWVAAHYAPQYLTPSGLHYGSTERQVLAAMGKPTSVDNTYVDDQGKHAAHLLVFKGVEFLIYDLDRSETVIVVAVR
ncbi:MAG TPA: hypothetical protein VKT83_07295 [bacterium]|nr:hypothetical protein [bacterium]